MVVEYYGEAAVVYTLGARGDIGRVDVHEVAGTKKKPAIGRLVFSGLTYYEAVDIAQSWCNSSWD